MSEESEQTIELPNVMLDLETLGVGDHAAIIQIGAVRFDWRPHYTEAGDAIDGLVSSPYGEFRQNVLWDDTEKFGRVEASCLQEFWLKQPEATRARVFDQTDAVSIEQAILNFYMWLAGGSLDEPTMWADSPNFDVRLLRQACERCDLPWQFKHTSERDLRTLKKEFGVESDEPMFVGTQHDALDDAHHQALYACNILRRIAPARHRERFPSNYTE